MTIRSAPVNTSSSAEKYPSAVIRTAEAASEAKKAIPTNNSPIIYLEDTGCEPVYGSVPAYRSHLSRSS